MQNDDGKISSTVTERDVPTARRKLVRGAFAAPVALTLCSGSAIAATSLSCVARQVSRPELSDATATNGTWIRVAVWKLTSKGLNGSDSTWISPADIAMLLVGKPTTLTPFIQPGEWYCLSAEPSATIVTGPLPEQRVVAKGKYLPSPSNLPPRSLDGGPAEAVATSTQIAVRVDASGNIIGVVDGANQGSAVTRSCWSSFKG